MLDTAGHMTPIPLLVTTFYVLEYSQSQWSSVRPILVVGRPASSPGAPKEFPMQLKSWQHIFNTSGLTRRWIYTHYIKLPGWVYDVPQGGPQMFRHRDFAGRVRIVPLEDRYLHHGDGSLRKLIVSCTDELLEGADTTTWRRTYLRKVSPLKVRIATWVIDFSYDPKSWDDWWIQLLRCLPAAFAMSFVFWGGRGQWQAFNGYYAPVPYLFHGTAKVWSNYVENGVGTALRPYSNETYRVLKPRHLCFLRNPHSDEMLGVDVRPVVEWEATDGANVALSYLFVAYSTEQFKHSSVEDLEALHHIAESAARLARIPAYWVACSCMMDPNELESDVYRISDVLRGSKEMIIVVGQSKAAKADHLTTDQLLAQWGSRMWTFPEVLLSPGEDIAVYKRGGNLQKPLRISKNQFAGHVWAMSDATDSRQLIDHYLGNLELSRLELAVIALKCLYGRDTAQYLPGDHAYALMGLLRLRPEVDQTDSQFQAFARISLANDSDRLLERYLCTMPVNINQSWHDMRDAYHSSLWDIEPYCQVAALCEDETVILDGAKGASIRWKSFLPVAFSTGPSLMHNNGSIFVVAISLTGAGASGNVGLVALGIILLLLSIYIWLQSPRLIRTVYGGKFTQVQAALFGFEGYINVPTIERAIFGGNFERMNWSTNGSLLSRFEINEFGERVGMDPTKDPTVRITVENAKKAGPGDMRVFTLVDTYNMEVTLFEAVRPPTVLLCCASEGGMQRAIGCSYDWTTQTMYREVVLRLPTQTLNRLERVARVRIGAKRPLFPLRPATALSV
ncbi:hypothetical protein F5Y12DRAFT_784935 [Xylaria sp. FL1777]|nr:hypothetical protein F5Y12DRAFT_784935 [Xylaria sp. FL1777]